MGTEAAVVVTEYAITNAKSGNFSAHGSDFTGKFVSEYLGAWFEKPTPESAHKILRAPEPAVRTVHRAGMDLYEYFFGTRLRVVYFHNRHYFGWAIFCVDGCFHSGAERLRCVKGNDSMLTIY